MKQIIIFYKEVYHTCGPPQKETKVSAMFYSKKNSKNVNVSDIVVTTETTNLQLSYYNSSYKQNKDQTSCLEQTFCHHKTQNMDQF